MRGFLKIAEGVDVLPVLNALAVNDDLWNENPLRTTHPDSPHLACDDIWVRFNAVSDDPAIVVDDIEAVPYRAWDMLPIKSIVLDIMRRVSGVRLGRVVITRLPPGASIPPHVDGGAPATYYHRYHLALQSLPGALNYSGNECVCYKSGELWWFDNRAPHSITNNSADDRIVLIIDVRH